MPELNIKQVQAALALLEQWKQAPSRDRSALTNASNLLVEAGLVPSDVEAAIDHRDIKAAALLVEKAIDDLNYLLTGGRLSRGQQSERELSQEELGALIDAVTYIAGTAEKQISSNPYDYFYVLDSEEPKLELTNNPLVISASSLEPYVPEGWKTFEFIKLIKANTPLNHGVINIELSNVLFSLKPNNLSISRVEVSGPNFLVFLELKDYDKVKVEGGS